MVTSLKDTSGILPESLRLDIGVLARLFSDTTTSYKLFFFLALLDRVERSTGDVQLALDRPIPLADLAVDMVLAAWYPHGFCRLSLGASDMLQHAVDAVEWGPIRGSWIKAGGAEWRRLRERCATSLATSPRNADTLTHYVPFRILRPFFARETRGLPDHQVNKIIVNLAESEFYSRKPLYCFTQDIGGIILHPDWIEYIYRNVEILRGWTRFHLAEYLQSRNPSIPGIIEKLVPVAVRAPLIRQTAWWRESLPLLGDRARCIYSGAPLDPTNINLDHYLPWSFVAHDRLWNLVPVARNVNSAKSDSIPDHRYLSSLVEIQHAAISAIHSHWPDARWSEAVEPWILDLGIPKHALLNLNTLRTAYDATIRPLEMVASRQGFPSEWVWKP